MDATGKTTGSKEELLSCSTSSTPPLLVGLEPDGTLRRAPMGLQHERLARLRPVVRHRRRHAKTTRSSATSTSRLLLAHARPRVMCR